MGLGRAPKRKNHRWHKTRPRDMAQALTELERIELTQALRAVLDALPPASGPLDSALRGRFRAAVEALEAETDR